MLNISNSSVEIFLCCFCVGFQKSQLFLPAPWRLDESMTSSGEEVSVSLHLRSRTMDRPDTPHPCVQQEHHGKEQTKMVQNCRNKCATWIEGKRKRHHAESDDIRRDETEGICCKSQEVGGSIQRRQGQCNPSNWRSYRMWRMLMGVICFHEWNVVEIGKQRHEGVMKVPKVRVIPHFFGEDICRIHFTSNMLDGDRLILDPFVDWVLVKLNVLRCFGGHVVGPQNAGIVVIANDSRFVEIQNSKSRFSKTSTDIT